MKSFLLFVIAGLMAVNSAAQVKVDMKAGLWQHAMKFEGDGQAQFLALQQGQSEQLINDLQAQLKNMPPEQRKMMEEALAQSKSQAGQMPTYQSERMSFSKDGIITKDCITQAEIDKGWSPDAEEGCTSTVTEVGKNKFKLQQVCEGDEVSSMNGEVTFLSTTQFSGKGTLKQTTNGKTYTLPVTLDGKWLGGECGAIKPQSDE